MFLEHYKLTNFERMAKLVHEFEQLRAQQLRKISSRKFSTNYHDEREVNHSGRVARPYTHYNDDNANLQNKNNNFLLFTSNYLG